jgi:hypothetical protein
MGTLFCKTIGGYMKCGNSILQSPVFAFVLVLPALLFLFGKTPLWSQDNEPLLRNSDEHLTTWTELSGKFSGTLDRHTQTLNELSEKLTASENSGQRSMTLSNELLRQNEDLRTYSAQIGERMQERDEDLVRADDRIAALEKQLLKAIGVAVMMGLFILGAVAFTVCRKTKIIPI